MICEGCSQQEATSFYNITVETIHANRHWKNIQLALCDECDGPFKKIFARDAGIKHRLARYFLGLFKEEALQRIAFAQHNRAIHGVRSPDG